MAAVDRITTGDQIEHAVVGEAWRSFAFEPAPLHRIALEKSGEEPRARQMNVGVGDRHRVRLDGNHDHMRIGFSDSVLDGQPVAGTRCGRRQAGMTEFQFLGCLDPAHECFDRGPILRQQSINVRSRDHFFRMTGGKPIKALVQVHDELMQAVAASAGNRGQLGDLRKFDIVVRAERYRFFERRQAIERPVSLHRLGRFDGASHSGDITPNCRAETAEARGGNPAAGSLAGAIDQRFHGRSVDTGDTAFFAQVEAPAIGIARVTSRRLQNAEARLDLVVRRQAFGNAGGQQQIGLPKLLDDLGFHCWHRGARGQQRMFGRRCF